MEKLTKNYFSVDILGTKYIVIFKDVNDDPKLSDCHGYTDFTTKKIVIEKIRRTERTFENLENYTHKVIRHEIIHAFLYESGLDLNSEWARNEELIDWIAIQFEKLQRAFEKISLGG